MRLPPELSIPEEDWERTPLSVQAVLLALWQENQTFKQQIAELRVELEKLSERVNKNSRNDGEGNILWSMCLAYADLGDKVQAKALAQQALSIYQAIESPHAATVKSWLETPPAPTTAEPPYGHGGESL